VPVNEGDDTAEGSKIGERGTNKASPPQTFGEENLKLGKNVKSEHNKKGEGGKSGKMRQRKPRTNVAEGRGSGKF